MRSEELDAILKEHPELFPLALELILAELAKAE